MCGRYTTKFSARQLRLMLRLSRMTPDELEARYNIAPMQRAPVVRQLSGVREASMLRWGLVPIWAKDESIASRLINARCETLREKPAFRAALSRRRCIVPASGFYEWKQSAQGKQPYYIHACDDEPLLLAGLWESWNGTVSSERAHTGAPSESLETFTVITTAPNAFMENLHDRMPALLERKNVDTWLDCEGTSAETAWELLKPALEGVLACHAVSTRVNSPRLDDERLIAPIDVLPGGLFER
jgi:putative SOS response-associated peptidase YedK